MPMRMQSMMAISGRFHISFGGYFIQKIMRMKISRFARERLYATAIQCVLIVSDVCQPYATDVPNKRIIPRDLWPFLSLSFFSHGSRSLALARIFSHSNRQTSKKYVRWLLMSMHVLGQCVSVQACFLLRSIELRRLRVCVWCRQKIWWTRTWKLVIYLDMDFEWHESISPISILSLFISPSLSRSFVARCCCHCHVLRIADSWHIQFWHIKRGTRTSVQ